MEKYKKTPWTAISLAEEIGVKEGTAHKCLQRLTKDHVLVKIKRGLYQYYDHAKTDDIKQLHDELPESLHGIKFNAKRIDVSDIVGSPAKRTNVLSEGKLSKIQKGLHQKTLFDDFQNSWNKEILKIDWRERTIILEQSQKSHEITLSCSDNPISILELDAFISALEMIYQPYFWEYDWQVTNYGINVDHSKIWIDGATSVTLQQFNGLISRWYSKKGIQKTRREIHSAIPVPITEITKNLRGDTPIGTNEVIRQLGENTNAFKKLARQYQQMLSLLTELLHAIDKLRKDIGMIPKSYIYERNENVI